MKRAEETDLGERLPVDALRAAFDRSPVQLAIAFGSRATGRTHPSSDVDLAVEFEGLRPGDDGYNDAYFGTHADVGAALGTDDVDLVDVHSASKSLASVVLGDGVLVYGDLDRVDELREQLTETAEAVRPPRDRLDDAIDRIDEHLA